MAAGLDPLAVALSAPPQQEAPLPPEGGDPEMLAQMLGQGMADPAMAQMAMQPPPSAGPMYPTADPNAMGEILAGILQMQQADQQQLGLDQQSALVNNPLFEALVAGAPLGPGAGQDGQAIGPDAGVLPMEA